MPYLQQALDNTGSDAVILGHNGTQISTGMNGQAALAADAVYAPTVVVGWFLVDGLLRVLDGDTYSGTIPEVLKDESNWGTSPDLFEIMPEYENYETEFASLWGIG